MVCNTCGRQSQNEEANFCEYCGNSFREHMPGACSTVPQQQITEKRIEQASYLPEEQPVSLLNWLGTYGLMLIPFVGWLVYLIMLFIWSFGNETPASKKNWARATLIFGVVYFIFLIVLIMSNPMLMDMLNGTFDMNQYRNSL